MYTLAHCSDWHTTRLAPGAPGALLNKRILGWLSWHTGRRERHRPEVLEKLFEDLRGQAPDHVAVTGDLTNVALEAEFREAAELLRLLGSPEHVSLIPGNHDAYVAVAPDRGWDLWAPYLRSDPDTPGAPPDGRAPRFDEYPTVRVRGPVALVGLCSALPTPWFRATGRLGAVQLERLERLLVELGERGLCRVVLLHHPPTERMVSGRRRLRDSEALRAVLQRAGAELVLHGHVHRSAFDEIEGPNGAIPAVGVRSASDVGQKPEKRAQYHLYDLETEPGSGRWKIGLRVRGLTEERSGFEVADERRLA